MLQASRQPSAEKMIVYVMNNDKTCDSQIFTRLQCRKTQPADGGMDGLLPQKPAQKSACIGRAWAIAAVWQIKGNLMYLQPTDSQGILYFPGYSALG